MSMRKAHAGTHGDHQPVNERRTVAESTRKIGRADGKSSERKRAAAAGPRVTNYGTFKAELRIYVT